MESIEKAVIKALCEVYEVKISNVLSTSQQYRIYSRFVADLSIMGLRYAVRQAQAENEQVTAKATHKVYAAFFRTVTKVSQEYGYQF